jgi:hypothetical protein|tara:strand:+ start:2085 stop:2234 length:150 start_codon:yes stop_codon:yes gene_type:complete
MNAGRISLPQRIVIAQVAGLRELCDHTSELVSALLLNWGVTCFILFLLA